MLSEARKYKLYLTMAEQTTSQQDEQQMVNVILANVGTVICFRSGNPSDEKLVLPLFEPYIEKGEIANLPSYNFYMRVAAQKSQEPLSGETALIGDGNVNMPAKVIEASHSSYHLPKELLCSKLGFFAMFWWGYFEEGCWRFAQAPEAQYPLEGRMGWLKNPAI
ncbi:hypothetical protein TM7_0567 [candidate division TM7 genomosp. GTL1]|nr:hypothetical protein TM7_0567 [candidate division TM7 genomosp. GTL1]